jgi:peroxiredoxin
MKSVFLSLFFLFFVSSSISQINNEYIKIGEKAPKIEGIDQFNRTIDSDQIVKESKILLLFYRGNWCPYCKKHLVGLQENLKELSKNGVYVIVVTPEKAEKVQETTLDLNITFSIIHDVSNKIMSDYKVAFDVNEQNVPSYLSFTQKKIKAYNELENNTLPVPATYLISKENNIIYVHYNPDYKKRADFNEILNVLN